MLVTLSPSSVASGDTHSAAQAVPRCITLYPVLTCLVTVIESITETERGEKGRGAVLPRASTFANHTMAPTLDTRPDPRAPGAWAGAWRNLVDRRTPEAPRRRAEP